MPILPPSPSALPFMETAVLGHILWFPVAISTRSWRLGAASLPSQLCVSTPRSSYSHPWLAAGRRNREGTTLQCTHSVRRRRCVLGSLQELCDEESNGVKLGRRVKALHKVPLRLCESLLSGVTFAGKNRAEEPWATHPWLCGHQAHAWESIKQIPHVPLVLAWADATGGVHHTSTRPEQLDCCADELALVDRCALNLCKGQRLDKAGPQAKARAWGIQEHEVKGLGYPSIA
mmetsp:Transcript_31775/g.90243  ORF Transcript_31775/g.90243 Transcript_31775/m.90243 type:complete len:232 (+) Transcript_31775:348-1043(+)